MSGEATVVVVLYFSAQLCRLLYILRPTLGFRYVQAMQISQRTEAVDIGTVLLSSREQEIRLKTMEQEVLKLRQDQKATDVSAEVLQIRRELRSLQKSIETVTAQSAPQQQ